MVLRVDGSKVVVRQAYRVRTLNSGADGRRIDN